MSSSWKAAKFVLIPSVLVILLWYWWSWYITSGQRTIEESLLQHEAVEAVQFTYYEGAALELDLWLKNGGFIHASGISFSDLETSGRGAIWQIGDARISCANAERAQTYEEQEQVAASLFEIGSMLYGDAKFSMFDLIDNYNEVEEIIDRLPDSYASAPTFKLNLRQFKDVYPGATHYEGFNSSVFVCRKQVSTAKSIPYEPGKKIRSADFWFHRKE